SVSRARSWGPAPPAQVTEVGPAARPAAGQSNPDPAANPIRARREIMIHLAIGRRRRAGRASDLPPRPPTSPEPARRAARRTDMAFPLPDRTAAPAAPAARARNW